MILFERRASVILFRVLRARCDSRPFLLPANVCDIVPRTFAAAGQPFEFIDLDDATLDIDVQLCVKRIQSDACAGVLFVRTYGHARDLSASFLALRAAQHDLLLIDDRCLSPPDCDGDTVHPLADVTLHSTGQSKYADLSEGGFAHAVDGLPYQRGTDEVPFLDLRPPTHGWNEYRRAAMAAAADAAGWKEAINEIYFREIPAAVQLPEDRQQWRFNLRVDDPDSLVAAIFEDGLFASRHYAVAANAGACPVALRLHRSVVNLFNDRHYDRARARRTAAIIVRSLGV